LGYPDNYDRTVSVIDLNTLTEIKKINVVQNPSNVVASANGNIYVKSNGNYDDVKPALTVIDSETDVVKSSKEFSGTEMTVVGDKIYFLDNSGIKEYDLKTETVTAENIITDGTAIAHSNGLSYNKSKEQFFVCD